MAQHNGQNNNPRSQQNPSNLPATRNNSAAMVLPSGRSFMPSTEHWGQIKEMGLAAYKSGMLPKSIGNAEAAAIVALKAYELGIPLMEGYSHIHVINGKATLSREMMQTLIMQNVKNAWIGYTEIRDEKTKAFIGWRAEGRRPGSEPLAVSFTMADAARAKLTTKPGPWQEYPDVMCMNRAATKLFRIYFPDALRGCSYTAEELEPVIETTGRHVNPPTDLPDSAEAPAIETTGAPVEPPTDEAGAPLPPDEQPGPAPAQPQAEPTAAAPKAESPRIAELGSIVDSTKWPAGTVLMYAKQMFGTGSIDSMNEGQYRALLNVIRNSSAEVAMGEFNLMQGTHV